MPTLSPAQIAGYASGAGFSSTRTHRGVKETVMAVAIALGESGGNTNAHNARPPDNSYGLWQINMLGALGPERRRQFGISSNEQLFNPAINARAAFKVFTDAGNSFRPWSVFLNGTYLRHLNAAMGGAAKPEIVGGAGKLPEEAGGDFGIGDFVSFFTSTDAWKRVGMFIGGGVLIIVAVVMLTGRNVDNIIPVGKALKAVKRVT